MRRVSAISTLLGVSLLFTPIMSHVLGYESKALGGVEWLVNPYRLTLSNWMSGEWQNRMTYVVDQDNPLRRDLIRLHSQVHFSTFGKSTNKVILGKEDQLFSYNYVSAYLGFDVKSDTFYESIADSIERLQNYLASDSVPLVVIIAPNKARVLSQYLPDQYLNAKGSRTQVSAYRKALSAKDIPYLDLNRVLMKSRVDSSRSYYTNTGTHWNYNGIVSSLPYLDSVISHATGKEPQGFSVDGGHWIDSLYLQADDDIMRGMNLTQSFVIHPQFIPQLRIESPWSNKPKVLLVSDSFGWGLVSTGFMKKLSDGWEFWYYNNALLQAGERKKPIDRAITKEKIKEFDVVLIMSTEHTIDRVPFGLWRDVQAGLSGQL